MSRILAVDWGTRRVGLAVSDPTGVLARPLSTLEVRSSQDAVTGVIRAADQEGVEAIVVGLPLHASGKEGNSARAARRLGHALEARGYRVLYVDERWTTEEARETLAISRRRSPDAGRVDQLAAVLLLQGYLDARATGSGHA